MRTVAQKQAQAQYMRAYRASNPAYREKSAALGKAWHAANPEKTRQYANRRIELHPERERERKRQDYVKHSDAYKRRSREWYANNQGAVLARRGARVAARHTDLRVWAKDQIMFLRSRCKRSGIVFDLGEDDIMAAYPLDERCPVLNIPLVRGSHGHDRPSIDRLEPALGYTKDNISILSMRANAMKSDATTPEHFEALAKWLRKRQSVAPPTDAP